MAIEIVGNHRYGGPAFHGVSPRGRDRLLTVIGTGQLAIDRARGVGVVAEVHGEIEATEKAVAVVERPEGGSQR